jgi:hypothetical protein
MDKFEDKLRKIANVKPNRRKKGGIA